MENAYGDLDGGSVGIVWEIVGTGGMHTSFEEKESISGRGKVTEVRVHITAGGDAANRLIMGPIPERDVKKEGLSKAAQSYRSRAWEVQRKVRVWLN